MNERIIEIAQSVDEKEWNGVHPDDAKWCVAFGELIIQECIKIMHHYDENCAAPTNGFYQAQGFVDAIKDGFKLNDDNALRV